MHKTVSLSEDAILFANIKRTTLVFYWISYGFLTGREDGDKSLIFFFLIKTIRMRNYIRNEMTKRCHDFLSVSRTAIVKTGRKHRISSPSLVYHTRQIHSTYMLQWRGGKPGQSDKRNKGLANFRVLDDQENMHNSWGRKSPTSTAFTNNPVVLGIRV